MEKSELLSITDFAKYIGVRQSVLRHYDEIGLFSPAVRGENGYRYYSPLQITAFNMINVLSGLRTVLREIADLRSKRTPQSILAHVEKQEAKFDAEMRQLHESYSIAHMYRRMINEALTADEKDVIEQDMPEIPIFTGPENKFEGTDTFYKDFVAFCQYAQTRNINLSYPVAALFHNMDSFAQHPSRPNFFYSLDPHGCDKKEAGRYLVAYTRGSYGNMNDIAERIMQYAQERKLYPEGHVHCTYLLDEVSTVNPDEYMARVCVRVRTKGTGRNR